MSIFEFQHGKQFHAWGKISDTRKVYLGTFSARTALEAGCQAANRHSGGMVLVKLTKFGSTVARV